MKIDITKLYDRDMTHEEMILLGYFVFSVNENGYAVKPDDDTWEPVLDRLVSKGILKVHGRNIRIDPTLVIADDS